MVTIRDILRAIISGLMPRSETGIIMELMAYEMACEGRL